MSRGGFGWVLLAVVAGCDAAPRGEAPAAPAPSASMAVHLPHYRPPADGGPEVFMEAGMGGTLARRGPCLGFVGESFSTIIWPADARLGSDAGGLFVEVGGGRFRVGEFLTGGGGTMAADFPDRILEEPFPRECDRSRAVEFHSIKRSPEGFTRPQPVPPPLGSSPDAD